MRLRRRDFPEVRDNLLTSVTGGIAAEAHPFPPPGVDEGPYSYSLLRAPASEIVSVYGSLNGATHLFRKDVDFALSANGQALEWPGGAGTAVPDEGSVFHVNYHPVGAASTLTDIYTGSVVRTVSESVALEMARLYAQLEAIYNAAFIDTSTGRSLDNLVALLGIERIGGGRAAGELVFERSPGSKGSVSIPAGTRVITPDGDIEYETITDVTMNPDQTSVRVVARDLEQNEPVDGGILTVLPVPIAGVGSVTNPAPTAITTRDETDPGLRTRAKNILHGSERATLGALETALRRQGVTADIVEVKSGTGVDCPVDHIEITPHYEGPDPELEQRIETAVREVRPAGIVVKLLGPVAPTPVELDLRLATGQDLLEQDRRAAQANVEEILEDFLGRLGTGEDASINKIVGSIMALAEVEDVTFVAASIPDGGGSQTDVLDRTAGLLRVASFPTKLGDLRITDPRLPTRVRALIDRPTPETPPIVTDVERAVGDLLATLSTNHELASTAGDPPLTVTYDELLRATPLPGVDNSDTSVTPTEGPYTVRFTVARETGEAIVLSAAGDDYELAPFERVAMDGAEVTEVEGA